MAGTLPPGGGSSMPAGTQVKKVVKGQQYPASTTPATNDQGVPPMHLPKPGK